MNDPAQGHTPHPEGLTEIPGSLTPDALATGSPVAYLEVGSRADGDPAPAIARPGHSQPAGPAPLLVPVPVPAPRDPADSTDLQADVASTAPLVVRVSGEIDIASAPRLREELLGVMRRYGARLALDLGGVTFMDCAGINVLLAARRHARLEGGRVRVVGASRRVRKVLMLTGLHQEFAPGPRNGEPVVLAS